MERMFGPVLYEAFRHIKRTFDPRPAQSRQDRRRASAHRQPAIRAWLSVSAAGDVLRLLRARRPAGRGRNVQRSRRLPEDARGHDVSVLHGDAGRGALDERTRERSSAGHVGPAGRSGPRRRGRASGARFVPRGAGPARPSARSASTWRGSRASSLPTTGAGTAHRSARTCSDMSIPCPAGAAGSRRSRTRSQGTRWCGRSTSGDRHRSTADAAGMDVAVLCEDLSQHVRRAAAAPHSRPNRTVALFNDTFTNYYSPAIGMAGLQVLEIAGLDVELAPVACCGRPLISQGLLAAARRQAASSVDGPIRSPNAACRSCFSNPAVSAIREDVPITAPEAMPSAARCAWPRGAVRRVPGTRMRSRAVRLDLADGARRFSCTGTVIRRRWAAWRRRKPCSAASGGNGRRSRCRLLRHGRLLWICA